MSNQPSIAFQVDNIPEELKSLPCWIIWRPEKKDGKWTKMPYRAEEPLRKASSSDSSTWTDFDAACISAKNSQSGIGFALSEDFGIIGIDFDKSLENQKFLDWINKFASYTEISPSGNGYHILVLGSIPKALKRGGVECYSKGRYLTVTGNHLAGTPQSIRMVNGELKDFYQEFDPQPEEIVHKQVLTPGHNEDVETILKQVRCSAQSSKFENLFAGNSTDYPSASEGDFALLNILVFWTQDPATIEEIALRSSRVRPKWHSKRGGKTWLNTQIEQALSKKGEGFDPKWEETEEEVYKPTRIDELILLVQKHRRQTPSFEEVRASLKLSPSRLSNLLRDDQDKGKRSTFRIIRQGRTKFLTLRKGTGLVRSERLDLDTLSETRASCYLPANFDEFVGTDLLGLKEKTFLIFIAETDFGKTEFLINCAVENINRGLRVAYVQHEDDANGFWWRVARRYLGRRPQNNQEADSILREKDIYSKIDLHICEDRAHLDEFLEDLVDIKPDLLIYDYLDQEYLETDEENSGRSLIHHIVHSFGNKLPGQGIPIFAAAQVKRKTGSEAAEINSNWLLRANVVLQAVNKPEWTEMGVETKLIIRKNKQGGNKGIYKLKMVSHPDSFRILGVNGVK